VSRFGLGLAALGRPGYLNLGHGDDLGGDRSVGALEHNAHEVLDAAYARGIRYFDAARSYGRAEEFLGSWLRARRPQDVEVGSKWGYVYTADWQVDADPPEVKHHDVQTFRTQLAQTRANLGDWLSLYQIHSATRSSGVLDDAALRDELAGLRSTGVEVGLTTTGVEQAETIERALEVGGFDSVQSTWNLIERSAGPALQRAHDAGLRVVIKEALANGRLTDRGHESAPGDVRALAAVLAQPFVDVVLSGASTVEQLKSNLAAREAEWTPELEQRYAGLVEPPDVYWEKRSALAWT
jgi:aryl-alcohol dehydrogenase-like predicted oxidoreductase